MKKRELKEWLQRIDEALADARIQTEALLDELNCEYDELSDRAQDGRKGENLMEQISKVEDVSNELDSISLNID